MIYESVEKGKFIQLIVKETWLWKKNPFILYSATKNNYMCKEKMKPQIIKNTCENLII